MTMTLKEKVARLKLVADGLRRIQEFESARYLDEYATHLTQPAQSVDVEKVPTEFVEDIQRSERLALKSKKLNRERMMGLAVVKHFGHLLTAALQEKGNG